MGKTSLWLSLGVLGATSSYALGAAAAPPGNWSVAVERLFGLSRVTFDPDVGDETSLTSFSVLAKVGGEPGYSVPRFGFDYIIESGASFGIAFGYQSVSFDGADGDAWLFAPRLGYFARVSSGFGIWPRAGITHIIVDNGGDVDDSATALTLEAPLEFFLASRVALTLTPLVELGLAGSDGGTDRTVTEIGLQLGLGAFF
jgi:hypothetical protein